MDIINKIESSLKNAIRSSFELNGSNLDDEEDKYNYKIFSDCICISYDCDSEDDEITSNNIFVFLLSLIYMQAELHSMKIFVRGGVSYNYHFINENIIFSSALVKSYEIESNSSIYPRIVIDNSVLDYLKKVEHKANFPELNEILKKDSDGLVFIDYLEIVGEIDEPLEKNSYLLMHKRLVEDMLSLELSPKIKEKYLWIAKYHNQKIIQLYSTEVQDIYLVSKHLLSYSGDVFIL